MRRTALVMVAAVLAGASFAAIVGGSGLGEEARNRVLDRWSRRGEAADGLVVVGFDEQFLREASSDSFGRFNLFITAVSEGHARAVVVEPDLLIEGYSILGEHPLTFLTATEAVEAAFAALPNTIHAVVPGILGPPGETGLSTLEGPIPRSTLTSLAQSTGFSTPVPADPGRPQRTTPLIADYPVPGGDPVPVASLPLLAAMTLEGRGTDVEVSDTDLRLGDLRIPVESDAAMRISYTDGLLPGGDSVISASDLVSGRVDPSRLEDRVVIAGVTDPNTAKLFPAPVGGAGQLPVTLVDANIANTIVTENFTAPVDRTLGVLLAAVAAGLVALGVLLLPLWLSPVPSILVALGAWQLAGMRGREGSPFDVALVLGACALAFLGTALWRGIVAVRDRRRTAALFEVYVSDAVAHELLDPRRAEAAAAGTRVDVASLFCDLRGFTPLTASSDVHDVRRVLDRFYEHTTHVIFEHEGTVMQYVGDEVFAVFGAPVALPSACGSAVLAARQMLEGAPALNRLLEEEGLPPIHFGIGLNHGEVVAAHVGTHRRRQYSVVGDSVNVASRLCGQAGGGEAVLTEEMWRAAGEPDGVKPMGGLDLKGVAAPVRCVRLTVERSS